MFNGPTQFLKVHMVQYFKGLALHEGLRDSKRTTKDEHFLLDLDLAIQSFMNNCAVENAPEIWKELEKEFLK